MRIRFRDLQGGAYTDQLRAADAITATLDTGELPNDGWLAGRNSLAAGRAPGAPPHLMKTVTIVLDSVEQYELAKQIVDAALGQLA